jgi:hypothetical protein
VAFFDTTWYVNSVGYSAVTAWATGATIAAGALRRQLATPTLNAERVFVAIVGGTTHATTEPTWSTGRGAKTTDNTVTWQECTGAAAVNGDATNTPSWTAVASLAVTLGQIIKRVNGASYWICSTAGTAGASEPAWTNNTAGTTQSDGTVTWTCLGVVGNFTGGQAPHARLANACAANWFINGTTINIFVGDNHAETQSTAGYSLFGTVSASAICRIVCHDHLGSYPPTSLATGATISVTGSGNGLSTNNGGSFYWYGITFSVGANGGDLALIALTSVGSGIQNWHNYENCSFQMAAGAGNVVLAYFGTSSWAIINLRNCTVKFGTVTQTIVVYNGHFTWQGGGLAAGSVVPNALFAIGAQQRSVTLEGLDLSAFTAKLSVFNNSGNPGTSTFTLKDCKLNDRTILMPQYPSLCDLFQVVRCDFGAAGFKSGIYGYEGVDTTITSATRTSGASDPTGQAVARKLRTLTPVQWLKPFKAEPLLIWNGTTGANVTVTVYGAAVAGSLPNNDDIWFETEYLGSGVVPLGSYATTTKASFWSANAAVAADASVWNSAPITFDDTTPLELNEMVLSNGNLTASKIDGTISTTGGVRSTDYATAGKYYFEMTTGAANWNTASFIGIILSTGTYGDISVSQINGTFVAGSGGPIYSNNANSGKTLGGIGSNQLICCAIDLDNRRAWFRKGTAGNWNGDATANPATNVGGVTIAAGAFAPFFVQGSGTYPISVTANFGASSYTGTAPSGFGNWAATLTKFKLVATLAPLPDTWNPADKSANMALSNGNLTATSTNFSVGV